MNARVLETPWMNAAECAIYLRYVKPADGTADLDCLYHAIARYGLPVSRMGKTRSLRFHRQFVDEWLLERGGRTTAEFQDKLRLARAQLRRAR